MKIKIEASDRAIGFIVLGIVFVAFIGFGFWYGAITTISQDTEDTKKARVEAAASLHMEAMK